MCRMSALVGPLNRSYRSLFMNQIMLASFSDQFQDSGSGLSDGVIIRKAAASWFHVGIEWLNHLNQEAPIWMGHVRKASRGTDLSPYEAHPFRFDLKDGSVLIAQHNGFVTGFNEFVAGEPNVDSYRAFKALVALMNSRNSVEIDAPLINEWTKKFGITSEWAFMFMHKGRLHIARGHRPMTFMSFDDGYIFNTSFDVLLNFKNWVRQFWPSTFKMGKITELTEFNLLSIDGAAKGYTITPLDKPAKIEPLHDKYLLIDQTGKQKLVKI